MLVIVMAGFSQLLKNTYILSPENKLGKNTVQCHELEAILNSNNAEILLPVLLATN